MGKKKDKKGDEPVPDELFDPAKLDEPPPPKEPIVLKDVSVGGSKPLPSSPPTIVHGKKICYWKKEKDEDPRYNRTFGKAAYITGSGSDADSDEGIWAKGYGPDGKPLDKDFKYTSKPGQKRASIKAVSQSDGSASDESGIGEPGAVPQKTEDEFDFQTKDDDSETPSEEEYLDPVTGEVKTRPRKKKDLKSKDAKKVRKERRDRAVKSKKEKKIKEKKIKEPGEKGHGLKKVKSGVGKLKPKKIKFKGVKAGIKSQIIDKKGLAKEKLKYAAGTGKDKFRYLVQYGPMGPEYDHQKVRERVQCKLKY